MSRNGKRIVLNLHAVERMKTNDRVMSKATRLVSQASETHTL
jgi:hypothetical protein